MLLTKTVMVKWGAKNKNYYTEKGYIYTKMGEEFEVKVEDLTDGSHAFINTKCDCKDCKNPYLKPIVWCDYKKRVKEDNKTYCKSCLTILYSNKKGIETRIRNGKSFEQWCVENDKQHILDLWDYKLNKHKPNEITYSSNGINKNGYWFKCPNHLEHKSELKNISNFTFGHEGSVCCNQCNSFAEYLLNEYGKNALYLYWDYEKNININPWEIDKSCSKKIYINCQEKIYHGSYYTNCNRFYIGDRCPFCSGHKTHPLDSLGKLLEDKKILNIWSDKNKKSPYEYAPMSHTKVWWKCLDGKHEDYFRQIDWSTSSDFRCPNCQVYNGEIKIENWLRENSIIDFIPQKTFDGLLGLKNGKLSYDFYLPNHNLLIEYQGVFHDGSGNWFTKTNLKSQREHDKRKKQYAEDNDIKLLPIWYWEYDNIENILEKEIM